MKPHLFAMLLFFAPLTLSALDIKIPDFTAAAVEAGPETRSVGDDGCVLLSQNGRALAVLRLREAPPAAAAEPVLSSAAAAAALNQPKIQNESVKEANGVLLQTRPVAKGARLLFTSAPAQSVEDTRKKRFAELPQTWVELRIFPDADGRALGLTYVDGEPAAEKFANAAHVRGRALTFETPKKQRVTLERSGPVTWQLEHAGNSIVLCAPLARDPHAPDKFGSFVLFMGVAHDEDPPETSALHLNRTQLPAREFVEGWARVYTAGANPLLLQEAAVVAEIALPPRPDGTVPTKLIPCYFWEPSTEGASESEFRFRFAPPAEGLYGVRLYVTTPANKCNSDTEAFRAGVPANPGWAHVRRSERVFRLDDGTIFTPVGVDLSGCKTADGFDVFQQKMVELERCNANTIALTLSHDFQLEGPEAGHFNPRTAELLDQIFFAAQARGIAIILALENGPDIGKRSAQHPYFREMGGPLIAQPEFFRDPAARRFFQARIAYAAARYGAFRSLLAWDLMRGLDEAWPALKNDPEDKSLNLNPRETDLSRRLRRDVEDWIEQMAQQLRGLDQHDHPIGVSTALEPDKSWLGLLQAEHLDWMAARDIAGAGNQSVEEKYPALNASMGRWATAMRGPQREKKPWGVLAFGARQSGSEAQLSSLTAGLPFAPLLPGDLHADLSEQDRVALRNAGLFAAALAEISAGDTRDEIPQMSASPSGGDTGKLFGRASKRGLAAWIQNPGATPGLEFKLPGLIEGRYLISWLDPRTGIILGSQSHNAPAQQVNQPYEPLLLKTPAFEGMICVFVVREAKKP